MNKVQEESKDNYNTNTKYSTQESMTSLFYNVRNLNKKKTNPQNVKPRYLDHLHDNGQEEVRTSLKKTRNDQRMTRKLSF